MNYKKLLQEHSPKDLAESFVFPVKLSAKRQKAADLKLYIELLDMKRRRFAEEMYIPTHRDHPFL